MIETTHEYPLSLENNNNLTIRCRMVYENEAALSERPFAFILPGGPGGNHSFYKDYDCLHTVANLVYYDPRGCGLSDMAEASTYTMDTYIGDLAQVISAIAPKVTILLGKSYGAMSALAFTLRYPTKVHKLILAAGAASYHFIETAKANIVARGTEEQIEVCKALWNGKVLDQQTTDHFFKVMDSMYSWKVRNGVKLPSKSKPKYPFAYEPLNEGFGKLFNHFNCSDRLHDITCPTLILVGEEDWITDPIYSKQMAKGISGSELHIFKQADHSMERDVPDAYFGKISAFISSSS